jgi:hypothetical protein
MSDPDLEALRELRDRNPDTALDADQRARIRARVHAAVTTPVTPRADRVEPLLEAEPVSLGGPAEVAPMPARPRRLLLAAAAVVAICALAALLATRRTAPSTTEVISQPPTMTIGVLAERARARPDDPLGATDFEHITTETGRALNPYDVRTRGLWAGTQGQGRETLANETRQRPTGAGTLRYPATDHDINTPADGVNVAGVFTYDQLRAFPTQPAELESAMFQASGAPQGPENLDLLLVEVLGRPWAIRNPHHPAQRQRTPHLHHRGRHQTHRHLHRAGHRPRQRP